MLLEASCSSKSKKIICSYLLKIKTTTFPHGTKCGAHQRKQCCAFTSFPPPLTFQRKGKKCRLTSHNPYTKSLIKISETIFIFSENNQKSFPKQHSYVIFLDLMIEFKSGIADSYTSVWLGGTDAAHEGTWKWTDGSLGITCIL